MKTLPSVIRIFLILALSAFMMVSFAWIGIMPVLAVQVLLSTLLVGVVLVLFADILMNASLRQRQ